MTMRKGENGSKSDKEGFHHGSQITQLLQFFYSLPHRSFDTKKLNYNADVVAIRLSVCVCAHVLVALAIYIIHFT